MATPKKKKPKGGKTSQASNGSVTFRRYITLPNGRVLDAHDYGHKAWPIGKR